MDIEGPGLADLNGASLHSTVTRDSDSFSFPFKLDERLPLLGRPCSEKSHFSTVDTGLYCVTEGKAGINHHCYQFFPTRILGLRRGSRFGSELAEARPSLAMMIINVKNPRTPTRRSMKTRCLQEKAVRFPPVRFLRI